MPPAAVPSGPEDDHAGFGNRSTGPMTITYPSSSLATRTFDEWMRPDHRSDIRSRERVGRWSTTGSFESPVMRWSMNSSRYQVALGRQHQHLSRQASLLAVVPVENGESSCRSLHGGPVTARQPCLPHEEFGSSFA